MRSSVAYTALLVALLVYTAVSVASSPDYAKAVMTFATNMLIAIMGLQALDGELDARPICSRMPKAVMVFGFLAYIFVLVAAMLVIVSGMRIADGDATYGAILNFTKKAVAIAVALAAANVMERAAKACDVAATLAMLSMALAFGIIAVV